MITGYLKARRLASPYFRVGVVSTLMTLIVVFVAAYSTSEFNIRFLATEPYRPIIQLNSGSRFHGSVPLVTAWPDGLLVWAEHMPSQYPANVPAGSDEGEPIVFRAARIAPELILSIVNDIDGSEYFENPGVGPGIPAGYGVRGPKGLQIQYEGRFLWLHHYIDDDTTGQKFIGKSGGWIPLNGATREEKLALEPEEYQRGYQLWVMVRSRVLDLIPQDQSQWHTVGSLDWKTGSFRPDPYAQSILPVPTPTPTATPTPTPTGS